MIQLPKPHIVDCSLYDALKKRRTHREICHDVSMQQLSNILWCANGVNEVKDERILRTSPSAHNQQEIELYVFSSEGVFQYVPDNHSLLLAVEGDYRNQIGKKDFVGLAPYIICIVANYRKMLKYKGWGLWKRYRFSRIDAGFVSQNIYLACVSEKLHTCACGLIHWRKIARILKLHNAYPLLLHPIG